MGIFNKNAVGVDISDSSIEVISLKGSEGDVQVLGKGRVKLSPNIVSRGRIKDSKKLLDALKKVLKESKPEPIKSKNLFVVLQEAVCFTCVVDLDKGGSHEVSDISEEAHKIIPISSSESVLSHKINNGDSALIIATQNEVLKEWFKFFKDAGYDISGFDSEPLALYRGLFSERKKHNVAIVDIGSHTTNVSLFFDGYLKHSYSVEIGGRNISENLTTNLKITEEEALKLQKEGGLSNVGSQESQVITKVLKDISDSLGETLPYYESKFNKKFSEIVLVGGVSLIPGIDEYFDTNLGIKTRLGSSFVFKKMGFDSILYIEAVGLAMRGIDSDWKESDPTIVFDEKTLEKTVVKNKRETKNDVVEEDVLETRKKLPKKIIVLLSILGVSLAGLIIAVLFKYVVPKDDNQDNLENTDLSALDEILEEVEQVIEEEEVEEFIEINSDGDLVNVRSGPGSSFDIITRVLDEEVYKLIEESDDWYQIEIDEETDGWISSEFAKINNKQ